MEYTDLLKSGIGAVIGFMLAQLVNVFGAWWTWRRRPILEIDITQTKLLSHTSADETGYFEETYYGFVVRNVGRSIATGVRFQVTGIFYAKEDTKVMKNFGTMALDLKTYAGAGKKEGVSVATIVPDAAVTVALGYSRDQGPDAEVIYPLADHTFDYYDEFCEGAVLWDFRVVAFDDSGHFVTEDILLRP